MKAIILLPYLFLLGCSTPAVEVKSEPQKIKKSSSSTKSISTFPMGHSKTKFEVEVEQQKNRVAARSQNYDSYGSSLSYLRDERDRQEEAYLKKKEQSEAFKQKIQSLNDEYDFVKVGSNNKDLSSDESKI
ncbi:hypothetical protein V5085_02640 [Moellerella wisconsensis]|uniref:hypothetical protein n=1 Tax=Moellerella wisconsensis TaxID=158849 RepID=UPI001F4DDB6F|nr:hypothetical protein [Moellerella wisconsensis]UNH23028.1 hypothetical protein MNY68_09150 [Moellerella wisconsensis]